MIALRPPVWRILSRLTVCLAIALSLPAAAAEPAPPAPAKPPHFETEVVPILRAYCWKCHGSEGRQAGLDLRSLPLILGGGKSGPAIERGSVTGSLLLRKLQSGEMPPGKELKPTDSHVATLRAWIEAGARANYEGGPLSAEESPPISDSDRRWWAFRPPVRPPLPGVAAQERSRGPVDAFLLARLAEQGLTYSIEAEPAARVRRLYLDVIGIPPDPDDVARFLNDRAPDADERLVDKLLASPHYGERFGRHWLDAAGYVDTIGTDNDATIIEERERIWQYRDFVIRSFNADKPFDRFLSEQIAGDELVDWRGAAELTPEMAELLVATGFLRQAADVTYAPELNTADIRHQVLFDTVQIFSSAVLGLSLHCAQCHTHKFDPLGHADYYKLAAFFAPAYDPQNWKHSKERFLADVAPQQQQEIDEHNAAVDRQVGELKQQVEAVREPFRLRLFESKLAALPEAVRADTRAALAAPADQRTDVQKYLVEKLGPLVNVTPAEIDQSLDDAARQNAAALNGQIGALTATKRTYGKIQALWDLGQPPPAYLLRRGDYQTPGARVTPGVPAVLDDPLRPFTVPPAAPGAATSGNRAALAAWLTRGDHPLTGRVFVNRVWQQFFGRGIVATPDNFGSSGAAPTHPALLDWLAVELAQDDWSVKRLQRRLLESSAYRQTSAASGGNQESIDPEIRLLWRMPLRRLDSEIVRDSILAVSGALEGSLYGPPVPLKANPDGSVTIDASRQPPAGPFRRSLYVFNRRNYQLSELNAFDQPAVAHNCTRRAPTAVVQQALTMLNSPLMAAEAERFAERVRQQAGADGAARIDAAFLLSLCREPDEDERGATQELLSQHAARYREHSGLSAEAANDAALVNLCQMLLNTNEFLYTP